MTGPPYPNVTTSTEVVATAAVAGSNQASAPGTVTDVVTGGPATHTSGATSSTSSSVSVQTGRAEMGAQIPLWMLALELAAVAMFVSYRG